MAKIIESQIPELIRQGRDKEAIDDLYKNILPLIKKYVMRNSGTAIDAEDVFQDAVVAFYQSVITGKFNPNYKVYGFVYKICIFRWINKEKKDKKLDFHYELEHIPEEELFVREEMDDEANVLRRLFSGLGEKCTELLNYSIIKDMLIEDIVIRMGFPSSTAVSMQIARCKDKLMQEISKKPFLIDKLKGI